MSVSEVFYSPSTLSRKAARVAVSRIKAGSSIVVPRFLSPLHAVVPQFLYPLLLSHNSYFLSSCCPTIPISSPLAVPQFLFPLLLFSHNSYLLSFCPTIPVSSLLFVLRFLFPLFFLSHDSCFLSSCCPTIPIICPLCLIVYNPLAQPPSEQSVSRWAFCRPRRCFCCWQWWWWSCCCCCYPSAGTRCLNLKRRFCV